MFILQRYYAIVEYDGTDFSGYQFQPNKRTVQGQLESVLTRLVGVDLRVDCAGRTDTGVHAIGQVIAFNLLWKHDLRDLHRALNALLPKDIVVKKLGLIVETFSPRFDALTRSYRYTVDNQAWPNVLQKRYAYHVTSLLNIEAMNDAAQYLVGTHDFASFGKPTHGESTTRQVIQAKWFAQGSQLRFDITANAFLYHMVRNIVGTLVQVGLGRLQANQVKEILFARSLKAGSYTAPAHGLCFMHVTYPETLKIS